VSCDERHIVSANIEQCWVTKRCNAKEIGPFSRENYMPRLDQSLIEDLTCHLREKPGLVERRERNESWMTAAEIANWIKDTRGIEHRSEEIEEELLAWWRADPHSRLIRPAKYPAENTIARLWGHVDRIGCLPESESQTFRTDPPIDLEALSLPPDAPVCFLSYAAPDLHFAARSSLSFTSRV
jgi:hypothetical protein